MIKIDQHKLDQLTQDKWQALSDEWERSKLTQSQFCELKSMPLKTFTNKRQQLLKAKRQEPGQQELEKYKQKQNQKENQNKNQKQFLPAHVNVALTQASATSSVVLTMMNGLSVHIASNTDKTLVRDVFELLGITSC